MNLGRTRVRRHEDVAGRVALVTGAARGIGFATAKALYASGASVALVDLDEVAAEAAAEQIVATEGRAAGSGEAAIGIGADVSDAVAIARAVRLAAERLGPIEICVANAGIAPHAATVRSMAPETFERVIDINLLGVCRTVQAVIGDLTENRGHIVLVSSVYAFTNGAFVAPYACSKAAVEQLGRALRIELAQYETTCSVAYFGFVDTEMVRQGFERDELGARLEAFVPRRLRLRITSTDAAEAILHGIERREPRIVAPPRWRTFLNMRGLLGPLGDRRMSTHPGVQALAREADRPGRTAGHEVTSIATPDDTGT